MEGILKLLRKLGYSEDEIKTVLNKVPVNQEGLTGTNVATGIFSKPKKGELAKDFLVSDTIGNPFEVNYFKGRSEKDILISAEAQLKMIDDELTKLTDQLLNKNLQLSEAQQINFAKNLETRKRFKKDFEAFKTKPEAEVLNIKTGETVTDLKKLIDEQGTKNPPTTVAGQLETTGKRLEQKGKELEEVTKPKSVIGDIMRDYSDFNKYMQSSQKTGYVRATVRQIMREDIQAGKLKLSKELQDQVMQGTGEPIDVYRKVYGEGALEQIDNLADDLGQFRTEEEAAKFARSKYTIEPKTKPVDESISYEELEDIFKKDPNKPEGKANGGAMGLDYLTGQEPPKNGYAGGGRIGYADGSNDAPSITLDSYKDGRLKPEDPLSKYKSYSELELLGNISAKKPNYEIEEEYMLRNMPVYEPKDVIPKGAVPTMPSEEYLRRRHQLDLAGGGRVNFEKGTIPRMLKFLIDKLADEKNFNKTLLEKSNPKAIQELYIEQYGKLPSAEEIKDIVNKQLQNKGSMEVMNPKTGEVTTPKNPIMTVEDLQFKHKDAFKAHDQIFNVDINDKIAPDMIAESMAEIKGKDYFSLSQKEQSDLYKKALAYVDDVRMTKKQNKPIEGGFSFNDPDIKAQMEEAMTVAKKRGDEMRAMGLDPAKSKDYDEYIKIKETSGDKNFNKYFDDLEIKTKFKGVISDDLLNQILIDDNPQRKAEVIATIEQGLTMQEKGMSPEEIVNILKSTTRTKQAQGGPIGLNYLMGF
jgi:DNA-binding transcriptional MerR regulator